MKTLIVFAAFVAAVGCAAAQKKAVSESLQQEDILTPAYYRAAEGEPFRTEVERFISDSRKETFHHPLEDESGKMPAFQVPWWGSFGAGKGPNRNSQHHPATDFKIDGGETEVSLYATCDGRVTTFRDAPKYRHYLAITKDVVADDGEILGKTVIVYGHINLDLNEADGLSLDGKLVRKGDLVSRHLYSGTRGGPHLHFEIRYYRAGDKGDETFYGARFPGSDDFNLSERSAGPWAFGFWNPNVGYGFANPGNHGIVCD